MLVPIGDHGRGVNSPACSPPRGQLISASTIVRRRSMNIKHLATAALRRSLPRRARQSLVNLGFNLDGERFQHLASKYLFAPDMRFGLESLARRGLNPPIIL